jgi:hypothetical protein
MFTSATGAHGRGDKGEEGKGVRGGKRRRGGKLVKISPKLKI